MDTIAELEIVKSTYTNSHRKYYEANKDAILTRYKENKPYKSFYQRNKERIKTQALARYYEKKLASEVLPPGPSNVASGQPEEDTLVPV